MYDIRVRIYLLFMIVVCVHTSRRLAGRSLIEAIQKITTALIKLQKTNKTASKKVAHMSY